MLYIVMFMSEEPTVVEVGFFREILKLMVADLLWATFNVNLIFFV